MQVLIVDDDATSLMITDAVIRRIDDADPVGTTDPRDALAWLENNTPDLILIDQVMPGMDGLAMLDGIRSRSHLLDVPVVMITAETSVTLRIAALERGCTDFLTKPIIVPELLARAQNLLRLRTGQKLLGQHAAMLRERVEEATAQLRLQAQELVGRLARAAEFRDPETGMHIERMANYARAAAEQLGLDPDECDAIQQAAPMHDIGKIGIPDSILLKPGRLTTAEMEIMKQHASIGYSILRESAHPLIALAAEIARNHHEKFNGGGYPRGVAGDDIPLPARIVAVADVFDALTTSRPYKRPWTLDDARQFLVDNRGCHFDPACVDAFLARWDQVVDIFDRHPEVEDVTQLH